MLRLSSRQTIVLGVVLLATVLVVASIGLLAGPVRAPALPGVGPVVGPPAATQVASALPTGFSGLSTAGPGTAVPSIMPTRVTGEAHATATTGLIDQGDDPTANGPADMPADPTQAALTPPAAPPGLVAEGSGSFPGQFGPVALPQGLYRLFFEVEGGAARLAGDVTGGECEPGLLQEVADGFAGSFTYRSTGCEVTFLVNGEGGQWRLRIETATTDRPPGLPVVLNGEQAGTSDVLWLASGRYQISLSTRSPFAMVTPVVVSGPCLERPVILATEPGEHRAEYTSAGCQIVFQVESVSAPWELRVSQAG